MNRFGTSSALRLGLILAGQMDAFILWTRSSGFTPGRLHRVPKNVEMLDEITTEFERICIHAYCTGVFDAAKRGEKPKAASLNNAALKRVETHAARLAAAAVHAVRTAIMPILEAVWLPDGTRVKPQLDVEAEIRTVYSTLIQSGEPKQRDRILTLATGDPIDEQRDALIEKIVRKRRSMKVRDQAQRDKYLATRKPFSKWIKNSVRQIVAESKAPPTLRPDLAVRWVQTEQQRFHTMGVLKASQSDGRVVGYRWVNPFAQSDICKSVHGMVLAKDDPQVSTYQTPLHHGCMTRIEPVYFDEDVIVYTPETKRPDVSLIAKGFGQVTEKNVPKVASKRRAA